MTSGVRSTSLVVLTVALALASCVAPPPTAAELEMGPLAFLRDGQATREQVLLRLGTPTAEFEGGRILTYRIAPGGEAGVRVIPRERMAEPGQVQHYHEVDYSLVLVFDDRNVLQKHRLVPLK